MLRTRIKICGMTRPQDARHAAMAGADAVGLIFHPPAPRYVSVDKAMAIIAELPAFVSTVGVFVDSDARIIRETAGLLGLGHVQLHGDESPEQVAELRGLRVIKALRVEPDGFARTLDRWRDAIHALQLTHLTGILLETASTGAAGGTGAANDWPRVLRHQQEGNFDSLPPVIAAGGLTPDTVFAVVRMIRPWAVDVSSGVEAERGVKSAEKIDAFIRAVREADHSTTSTSPSSSVGSRTVIESSPRRSSSA